MGGVRFGLCLDLGFLGFLKTNCGSFEDGLLGLCFYSCRCLGLCLVGKEDLLLGLCLYSC